MVGISNTSIITQADITSFGNVSGLSELLIKVNNNVYDGLLFFILLIILCIIIFFALQDREDQPAINLMYACASISIIGFFLRAIISGDGAGLITDRQVWIFPLITIILALFNYITRDQ